MSAKKFSNFLHDSQGIIPRPPYLGYTSVFGFKHLFSMVRHILYSVLFDIPCVLFLLDDRSLERHPHDFVCPDRSPEENTDFIAPQSHLHSHFSFDSLLIMVSRENLDPSNILRCKHPQDEVLPQLLKYELNSLPQAHLTSILRFVFSIGRYFMKVKDLCLSPKVSMFIPRYSLKGV